MEHNTGEDRILQVLRDYQSGKFDKYEAMDALDLDHVGDLLSLLSRYEVGPELTRDYFQTDPSAKTIKELLSEDD